MHTAKQITDLLLSTYQTEGFNETELSQLLNDNIFFVTMMFERIKFEGLGSRYDPTTYLNIFHNWFRTIMMEGLGPHYGRKSKRIHQPLAFAFVDFPGSRYRGQHEVNTDQQAQSGLYDRTRNHGSSEFLKSGPLHIHAVVALRPGPGQVCRLPILNSVSLPKSKFGRIDVQPFDPNKGTLQNLIEYSMKGAIQIGSATPSDCWEQFPRYRKASPKPSTVAHRQSEGLSLVR